MGGINKFLTDETSCTFSLNQNFNDLWAGDRNHNGCLWRMPVPYKYFFNLNYKVNYEFVSQSVTAEQKPEITIHPTQTFVAKINKKRRYLQKE